MSDMSDIRNIVILTGAGISAESGLRTFRQSLTFPSFAHLKGWRMPKGIGWGVLIANCLAQSRALMRGRTLAEARARMEAKGLSGSELERQARHRVFPGNRPSTTLAYPQLTPFTLGQIIALYEHRVFVEGVILGLNSYDQWGVELGKELALALQPVLEGKAGTADKDGSTAALVAFLRDEKGGQ